VAGLIADPPRRRCCLRGAGGGAEGGIDRWWAPRRIWEVGEGPLRKSSRRRWSQRATRQRVAARPRPFLLLTREEGGRRRFTYICSDGMAYRMYAPASWWALRAGGTVFLPLLWIDTDMMFWEKQNSIILYACIDSFMYNNII